MPGSRREVLTMSPVRSVTCLPGLYQGFKIEPGFGPCRIAVAHVAHQVLPDSRLSTHKKRVAA